MRKAGRLVFSFLLCLSALFTSGCWGQEDIAHLGIVLGVGIDIIPANQAERGENLLLTVELANITDEDKSSGEALLVSATGRTVFEAVRNISQQVYRDLHFGHIQILLIGEEAAEQGVDQYLHLFFYDHDMSPSIYLFMCEGTAWETFSKKMGAASYLSLGLRSLVDRQKGETNGYIMPVSLKSYVEERSMEQAGALIPMVAEKEQAVILSTGSTEEQKQETSEEPKLYLKGMAVLDQDGKYIVGLEQEENIGTLMWLNKIGNFDVVCEEPNMKQYVTVEVAYWRCKKKWDIDIAANRIDLYIEAKADCYYGDEQKPVHYANEGAVRHLEKLVSVELERYLRLAYGQAVEQHIDFLRLGLDVWRHHFDEWNHYFSLWPETLQNFNITYKIDTTIEFAGQAQ